MPVYNVAMPNINKFTKQFGNLGYKPAAAHPVFHHAFPRKN